MGMNSRNYDYSDILDEFGEEKIGQRYDCLRQRMEAFIKRNKYENNVMIADSVLSQAVIDYFMDVYRLKNFHKIKKINFVKIHAYTAYWILRRKPLQIIQDNVDDVELAFVNERFVASYLESFLRGDFDSIHILENERLKYNEFIANLEYYLRYRAVNAQMLETMIEAYNAGMAFEKSIEYAEGNRML